MADAFSQRLENLNSQMSMMQDLLAYSSQEDDDSYISGEEMNESNSSVEFLDVLLTAKDDEQAHRVVCQETKSARSGNDENMHPNQITPDGSIALRQMKEDEHPGTALDAQTAELSPQNNSPETQKNPVASKSDEPVNTAHTDNSSPETQNKFIVSKSDELISNARAERLKMIQEQLRAVESQWLMPGSMHQKIVKYGLHLLIQNIVTDLADDVVDSVETRRKNDVHEEIARMKWEKEQERIEHPEPVSMEERARQRWQKKEEDLKILKMEILCQSFAHKKQKKTKAAVKSVKASPVPQPASSFEMVSALVRSQESESVQRESARIKEGLQEVKDLRRRHQNKMTGSHPPHVDSAHLKTAALHTTAHSLNNSIKLSRSENGSQRPEELQQQSRTRTFIPEPSSSNRSLSVSSMRRPPQSSTSNVPNRSRSADMFRATGTHEESTDSRRKPSRDKASSGMDGREAPTRPAGRVSAEPGPVPNPSIRAHTFAAYLQGVQRPIKPKIQSRQKKKPANKYSPLVSNLASRSMTFAIPTGSFETGGCKESHDEYSDDFSDDVDGVSESDTCEDGVHNERDEYERTDAEQDGSRRMSAEEMCWWTKGSACSIDLSRSASSSSSRLKSANDLKKSLRVGSPGFHYDKLTKPFDPRAGKPPLRPGGFAKQVSAERT